MAADFSTNSVRPGHQFRGCGKPKATETRPFTAFNYPIPWPYSGGLIQRKPEAAMNAKTIIIGLVILAVVITIIINCN